MTLIPPPPQQLPDLFGQRGRAVDTPSPVRWYGISAQGILDVRVMDFATGYLETPTVPATYAQPLFPDGMAIVDPRIQNLGAYSMEVGFRPDLRYNSSMAAIRIPAGYEWNRYGIFPITGPAGTVTLSPTGATGIAPVTAGALVDSWVIKAAAGNLYRLWGTYRGGAQIYLQLHNAAALPANGVAPLASIPVGPGIVPFSFGTNDIPDAFTTGIVLAGSTTADTLTVTTTTLIYPTASRV